LQVQADHGVLVYGRRPVYAAPEVGGLNFTAGKSEAAIQVLVGTRSSLPSEGLVDVVSVPSRPGLLSRARAALGRLRGRSR
jgi:hypothetical protein